MYNSPKPSGKTTKMAGSKPKPAKAMKKADKIMSKAIQKTYKQEARGVTPTGGVTLKSQAKQMRTIEKAESRVAKIKARMKK